MTYGNPDVREGDEINVAPTESEVSENNAPIQPDTVKISAHYARNFTCQLRN